MEHQLIEFIQNSIKIRSFSDQEEKYAMYIKSVMENLAYDNVYIDEIGNIVGILGEGDFCIHFDGHMDTVEVNDEKSWTHAPFEGIIDEGYIWGRGTVDMKAGLGSMIYAAAYAKKTGKLKGKKLIVTASICEEYCDGVNLKFFYESLEKLPDLCIIGEPSDNKIALGHNGKAQMIIKTLGKSAHGSTPQCGINAVYEMADIVKRIEELSDNLLAKGDGYGTIVLSNISSVSASLNAIPSECQIYLDRRIGIKESINDVKREIDKILEGKKAVWQIGTLNRKSWTNKKIEYEPLHDSWKIDKENKYVQAFAKAYYAEQGTSPEYMFWQFSTNAVTPVSMGITTIGFGPGDYKLAHMVNEKISIEQIVAAYHVYYRFICMI